MFAVSAPQTVTLNTPGEDKPDAMINFKLKEGDSSRCIMQVVFPEGEMHELVFNVRGSLVDSHYTVPQEPNPDYVPPTPADYIVDGRDIRAFNPYTHVAPVDADSAYRDGQTPGFTAPRPQTDEERELEQKAKDEAAASAKEQLDALVAQSRETPEERTAREQEEADKRREAAIEDLNQQNDVTTGTATAETFPSQKTQDLVEGKTSDGTPINESTVQPDPNKPDYNPMAPAPSSPLPGSPPPQPLDQPDHGKVTTSKDFSGEPAGTFDEQDRVKAAEEKKREDLSDGAFDVHSRGDDALAVTRKPDDTEAKLEEQRKERDPRNADAPVSG